MARQPSKPRRNAPRESRDDGRGPTPPPRPVDALRLLTSAPVTRLASAHAAVVGPLAEYERLAGGDLVRTLRAYVATGGNAVEAARRLGTHRNTVLNRLVRINALLGEDVRHPDTLFRVHAALRAGDVLGARGASESGAG